MARKLKLFRLTVEEAPARQLRQDPRAALPASQRIRWLARTLSSLHGFRCVRIEEITDTTTEEK